MLYLLHGKLVSPICQLEQFAREFGVLGGISMAKSFSKGGGISRLRFVLVEAESGDGDLGQLTQTIANALRGPIGAQVKRIAPPVQPTNGHSDSADADAVDNEVDEIADAAEVSEVVRQRVERKPAATPEVLAIDFNSFDPSLDAFAAEHRAESHQQRYLLAAAWFHEHGGVTKVTPAHIYTAYRWLKWPLTLKDFAQPLRDLKREKLFGSTERGTYTINHIGLQRVADMKSRATGNGTP
jgi:hypothetical protein